MKYDKQSWLQVLLSHLSVKWSSSLTLGVTSQCPDNIHLPVSQVLLISDWLTQNYNYLWLVDTILYWSLIGLQSFDLERNGYYNTIPISDWFIQYYAHLWLIKYSSSCLSSTWRETRGQWVEMECIRLESRSGADMVQISTVCWRGTVWGCWWTRRTSCIYTWTMLIRV